MEDDLIHILITLMEDDLIHILIPLFTLTWNLKLWISMTRRQAGTIRSISSPEVSVCVSQ